MEGTPMRGLIGGAARLLVLGIHTPLFGRVTPTRLEVVSVQRGLGNDPKTWLPAIAELSAKR
jgi:hypothetical protein